MDVSAARIFDPQFSSTFFGHEAYIRSKSLNPARRKVSDGYSRSLLTHYPFPCDPSSISRFFPFESERKRPLPGIASTAKDRSHHSSYSPGFGRHVSRSATPVPRKCTAREKRGADPGREELNELKSLIEMSVIRQDAKRAHTASRHVLPSTRLSAKTASVLITQITEKENNDSLRDTIDSQVLNNELHYIENLQKAANLPMEAAAPPAGDCPLRALKSYDVKKKRRNLLHLHGVIFPNPGKPLVTDPSENAVGSPKQANSQGTRRLPTAFYRLRMRKDSRKPPKNEDCLKVIQMKCRPSHEKAVSLFTDIRPVETEENKGGKLVLGLGERCESEESEVDMMVSKQNLKMGEIY